MDEITRENIDQVQKILGSKWKRTDEKLHFRNENNSICIYPDANRIECTMYPENSFIDSIKVRCSPTFSALEELIQTYDLDM